jgi:(1->4)-alpha-D-glucan 1-alpha-D-glucosylmutase
MIPRATYRLQFFKDFGFDDAASIAPYLHSLGISHVYASPYLKARAGSTHGYDIVDHDRLNPELGDEAAFQRMVTAFQENGLGQVLDFVPNHMGVGGADNPLWLDVLEWGPESRHAGWFDIDWDPDRRYLRDKLLVPCLGDQYGVELGRGQIKLVFDGESGEFAVWAYDTYKLPICPLSYAEILGDAHFALEQLGDAFSGLPEWRPQVGRRATELKQELATAVRDSGEVRAALEAAVAKFNDPAGANRTALPALIEKQFWRVAHFRVAADDINYRRFFNINDLAGLRMELPEVFDHAHRLIFRLLKDGTLDGLRIDHIDGLLDPKSYLQQLRAKAPWSDEKGPFYLVVEKILAQHEQLRDDWPVQGTTGYEFVNLALGFLVDPEGEAAFSRIYSEFTGKTEAFEDVVHDCKLRIMENEMSSELNVLARDAGRVARENPSTADFTRNILHRALKQVVACFPVYRTYLDMGGTPTSGDRRDLDWALARARRKETDLDPSVFDFLGRLLSAELVATPRSGFSRSAVLRCAMKFQQYSGPVMAKGLEDTAFYRYNRFVALNEVGGHPDQFGVGLSAFHKANSQRARDWPQTMLGTSTHDTKRGEDTRARLAALSEMPDEWARHVQTWSRILRARRGDVEGTAPPDRNDEYLFYQLLIGTWPAELTGVGTPGAEDLGNYAERLKAAMVKSMREAKVNSTWASPNLPYEEAMQGFVDSALDPNSSNAFMDSFLAFQQRVAELGVQNSLVQLVLKLTLPGVPDIYQGAELWDLSLVDPDNRRPVDYAARAALLRDVQNGEKSIRSGLERWQDGSIKLTAAAAILKFRARYPQVFEAGGYTECVVEGAAKEQICAFTRSAGGCTILVVVRRFPTRASPDGADEAALLLPEASGADWHNLFTDRTISIAPKMAVSELLTTLPVAVLVKTGTA